jgi:asparagine synthase (glutamine-hydrolysing)
LDWVAEELSPATVAAAGYFEPSAIARLARKLKRLGTLSETDEMALAGVLSTHLLYREFVARPTGSTGLSDRDDVKEVHRLNGRDPKTFVLIEK